MVKKDKPQRLAKGLTDPAPREWNKHEQYMLYCRGWRDGAALRAMDLKCEGLDWYMEGYSDGCAARCAAQATYAKKIGYKPNYLRLT